jgi:hypothetical protein
MTRADTSLGLAEKRKRCTSQKVQLRRSRKARGEALRVVSEDKGEGQADVPTSTCGGLGGAGAVAEKQKRCGCRNAEAVIN